MQHFLLPRFYSTPLVDAQEQQIALDFEATSDTDRILEDDDNASNTDTMASKKKILYELNMAKTEFFPC